MLPHPVGIVPHQVGFVRGLSPSGARPDSLSQRDLHGMLAFPQQGGDTNGPTPSQIRRDDKNRGSPAVDRDPGSQGIGRQATPSFQDRGMPHEHGHSLWSWTISTESSRKCFLSEGFYTGQIGSLRHGRQSGTEKCYCQRNLGGHFEPTAPILEATPRRRILDGIEPKDGQGKGNDGLS